MKQIKSFFKIINFVNPLQQIRYMKIDVMQKKTIEKS